MSSVDNKNDFKIISSKVDINKPLNTPQEATIDLYKSLMDLTTEFGKSNCEDFNINENISITLNAAFNYFLSSVEVNLKYINEINKSEFVNKIIEDLRLELLSLIKDYH